jgi:hypothetical protein
MYVHECMYVFIEVILRSPETTLDCTYRVRYRQQLASGKLSILPNNNGMMIDIYTYVIIYIYICVCQCVQLMDDLHSL